MVKEIEMNQKIMMGIAGGLGIEYKILNKSKLFSSIDYLYNIILKNEGTDSYKIAGFQFRLGYLL